MTGLAGVNPQEGGRSSDDGSSVIPKGVSVIAGADEADDAVDAWRWVGLLVVASPDQSSIVNSHCDHVCKRVRMELLFP